MKYLSRCVATLFALSLIALSTGPAPAVIRPMWGGHGKPINISGMYSGSISDSVLGTGTAVANFAQITELTGGGSGSGDVGSLDCGGGGGDVRALDCGGCGGGGGDVRTLDCGGGGGVGILIGGYLNATYGTAVYSSPLTAGTSTLGGGGGGGGNGQWQGGPLKHGRGGGTGGGQLFGIFVTIIGSAACSFAFKAGFDPSTLVLSGTYRAVVGCSGESGTFSLTQQCYYHEINLRRSTGSGLGACS